LTIFEVLTWGAFLVLQSLAEWAQARATLVREAANAHVKAAAAREASLQARIEAV
jgi:hypothetical protein